MRNHWIVVASADHIGHGKAEGFMQACHGREAPLKRMRPGDGIACYSPSTEFRGSDRRQSFTAIGIVSDGDPYRFDMGAGFVPCRRDVEWAQAVEAPIHPLLEQLSFTANRKNWGYQFRFGLFGITQQDFEIIAAAMSATIRTDELQVPGSNASSPPRMPMLLC
ncbi:EVE domain-containing protein [Phyllobacterium sp. SB3]|uniref:EVE domain-containing protein n=1 Tax=Phyllobacterium sp. SB3 TaxID=3156073 RepID=UPI0032AF146C